MHLCVSLRGLAVSLIDANLAQDFTRLKRRGQQIDKEVVSLDRAFAVLADRNHLSAESDDRGGPIAGRIGVRDAAADRAFIAHLHVADM